MCAGRRCTTLSTRLFKKNKTDPVADKRRDAPFSLNLTQACRGSSTVPPPNFWLYHIAVGCEPSSDNDVHCNCNYCQSTKPSLACRSKLPSLNRYISVDDVMFQRTEMIRSHNLDLLTSDRQRVITYHVHQNGGQEGASTFSKPTLSELPQTYLGLWSTRGQPICQYDSAATARVTECDHDETVCVCRRLFTVVLKTAREKMMEKMD